MEEINSYLSNLETSFPLSYQLSNGVFNISNSGRRGETKEFSLSYEAVIDALNTIINTLRNAENQFSSKYVEAQWREAASLFSNNTIKSLCGVQTRPFFELINKLICYANGFEYREGEMILNIESIDKTITCLNEKIKPSLNDYEIFAIPKHSEITGSKEEVKNALIQILKNHKETNTTYIPQKIGFEYAEIMKFHNFQSGDIKEVLAAVEISDNRSAECLSSLKLYDFCLENFKVSAPSVQQYFKNLNSTISKNLFPFTPSQSIFYGVPGCGKSFHVKKELERLRIDGEHTVRVVFHPDYSNADFVGQIYPDNSDYGKVVYKFKPGPFSKILKKAYLNPSKPYCLVIEEINRGNAAAIFGDLFQLLDRIEKPEDAQTEGVSEGSGNNYGVGWSAYGVDNDSINGYFRSIDDSNKSKEKLPENVTAKNFEGDENPHWYESLDISIKDDDELKSYIHFNANTAIRLPPNLSILATMNTSDQNVFTLDNAFQRRWKMEYIANKLDETSAQYNLEIANTGVKWGGFHKAINQLIKDKTSEFNFGSTEDKCLGGYFITGANDGENKGKIDGKEFAEKVLKFLWDDVFKMDHSVAFNDNIKSFTDLLTAFNEGKTNTFNEILKINLYKENANANV